MMFLTNLATLKKNWESIENSQVGGTIPMLNWPRSQVLKTKALLKTNCFIIYLPLNKYYSLLRIVSKLHLQILLYYQ